jgi:cation-transporting P-type ATPase C
MMDNLKILHSLPGRTRIQLSTSHSAAVIESYFRLIPAVFSANYSAETKSLLLYHDPKITSKEIIHYSLFRLSKSNGKKTLKNETNEIKKNIFHIFLGASTLILEMVLPSRISGMGFSNFNRLPSLVALFSSREIFKNGVRSITERKRANADTLTATAMIASILKGTPNSAIIISIMSSISEILTSYTVGRTRNYVRDMMELNLSEVWKINDHGKEEKVPIESIKPNDQIAVFTGEKIPVDGRVLTGSGTVDESSITGEFIPREVDSNHYVYAGSILQAGQIKLSAEHVGEETAVTKIIQMIEEAQTKKAPIQSMADQYSEKLVPISFVLAALTYITTRSWDRVLNMLVIDFICGLKLSTSTAISAAIGEAAKKGIIIKGGEYIERLSNVDTLLLDKTGTITEGKPVVNNTIPFHGFSQEEVISYAASAEEHSSHPIAEAILKHAQKWGLNIPEHDHNKINCYVGKGMSSEVNGKPILVGNLLFMEECTVDLSPIQNGGIDQEENLIYVAYDQKLIGVISIYDKVRTGMKRTINKMRRDGIDEVVMLTGDKKAIAQDIAQRLSMDSYQAEILPHEKAAHVKAYKQKNKSVMMVGDGINDAPSLAYADVGVTMGAKRTDIAMEASDIIIMSDDPATIAEAFRLSKQTMNIIKQNIAMTILINSSAIILGAIGMISPFVGAAVHNGATILVVLNGTKTLLWGDNNHEGKIRNRSRSSRTTSYYHSSIKRQERLYRN